MFDRDSFTRDAILIDELRTYIYLMVCIRCIPLPLLPIYILPVLIVDTSYVMTPNDRECVNPGRGTVAAGLADRKGNSMPRVTRTNREITSSLVIGDRQEESSISRKRGRAIDRHMERTSDANRSSVERFRTTAFVRIFSIKESLSLL